MRRKRHVIFTNFTKTGEEEHQLAAPKINDWLEKQRARFKNSIKSIDALFVPSFGNWTIVVIIETDNEAALLQFTAALANLTKVNARPQLTYAPDEMISLLNEEVD